MAAIASGHIDLYGQLFFKELPNPK